MKKHIKKKLLIEVEFSEEQIKQLEGDMDAIPAAQINKIKKIPKGQTIIVTTDKNTVYTAFLVKDHNGNNLCVPQPDPVLLYFHSAYTNYRLISDKQKELFRKLKGTDTEMGEPAIIELYDYFGFVSGFVIFLFTALEAFMNRRIDSKYEYKKIGKKNTEIYTKNQIEEFISFYDKMNIVIPDITKKDFSKQYMLKYQHIVNLKEFRDSIVHTKASKDDSSYDYLYRKAFTFKYDATINAVADFCNYYHPQPDYIVECDCSQNW